MICTYSLIPVMIMIFQFMVPFIPKPASIKRKEIIISVHINAFTKIISKRKRIPDYDVFKSSIMIYSFYSQIGNLLLKLHHPIITLIAKRWGRCDRVIFRYRIITLSPIFPWSEPVFNVIIHIGIWTRLRFPVGTKDTLYHSGTNLTTVSLLKFRI